MNNVEKTSAWIRAHRLIPVVRTETAEQALRASGALIAGGIAMLEITLTVPGAIECIGQLARQYGDVAVVGAGTVLDAEACRQAIDAGARFIVTPALRPAVIEAGHQGGAAVMAGALTPTEVVTAWELGAEFVKVFPCDAMGGPAYIKALRGPLPHIPLVPTGGVSEATAAAFLQAGATALGIGGSLLPKAELRAGDWESIRARAARLVQLIGSPAGALAG
jgi:2-dehydro-3-deoxyphosphogluconate aldolase/(4S)-4-hydroxy-2-oxoglutarate aldolase